MKVLQTFFDPSGIKLENQKPAGLILFKQFLEIFAKAMKRIYIMDNDAGKDVVRVKCITQ